MTDVTKTRQNAQAEAARTSRGARARRLLSLALCAVACLGFLATLVAGARVAAPAPPPAPAAPAAAPQDEERWGVFLHSEHNESRDGRLSCNFCHQPASRGNIQPGLPGHKSCLTCHVPQFLTSNHPICTICHTDLEQARPGDKPFPGLKSFNAVFPHDKHESGAGLPADGCADCHAPERRGVTRGMPARISAHDNCYRCHSSGGSAGGELSSCAACHKPGRLAPAPVGGRAFNVGFSHNDHGPRQGLDCTACHNVRAGDQNSRLEVSSPRPTQHFGSGRAQSCMTCHDNRRAFGGEDFADCKRCHTGPTFSFGGGGPRRTPRRRR